MKIKRTVKASTTKAPEIPEDKKVFASKYMRTGNIDEMIDTFEAVLNNAKGVTSATSVTASDDTSVDDNYVEVLVTKLHDPMSKIESIKDWNITINEGESFELIVISTDGTITEYTVPYKDLSGDDDKDVNKLIRIINHEATKKAALVEDDWEDVETSTEVEANQTVTAAVGDDIVYKDVQGQVTGTPGELITLAELNKMWNDNHEFDESMQAYNTFNDWFKDTEEWLEEVDNDSIYDDMPHATHSGEDHDAIISWLSQHNEAFKAACDYFNSADLNDISAEEIEAWVADQGELFADYCDYFGYDQNDIINSCDNTKYFANMVNGATQDITEPLSDEKQPVECENVYDTLSDKQKEQLEDIVERYTSSTPLSGDWATETEHEQRAIAEELGISLDDAKSIMIDTLGFEEEPMGDDDNGFVKASTYKYELRHGWGPGTLPKEVEVLEHTEDGYKDIVVLNRPLTDEELSFFDIKPIDASCGVKASEYDDAQEEFSKWKELETKQVKDSDDFLTDYTLYESISDDNEYKYICMFGDKDIYGPDETFADWSGDNESEAYEWFESYNGFDED